MICYGVGIDASPIRAHLPEANEPGLLAKEAFLAAKTRLFSGTGTGRYEVYRAEGGQEPVLSAEAGIAVHYSNGKCYIKLNYRDKAHFPSSLTIISDGKTILSSRFSPLFRPIPAEGAMDDLEGDRKTLARAGFPFNPNYLYLQHYLDIKELLASKAVTVSFEKLPDEKGYKGTYTVGMVRVDFTFTSQSGYNIDSVQKYSERSPLPISAYKLQWAQTDGIWYVKRIEEIHNWLNGMRTRSILDYESFIVNPSIDEKWFSFSSLELPENARILDNRPGANPRAFLNKTTSEAPTGALDEVLQQLDVAVLPIPRSNATSWRKVLLLSSLVVTIIGLGLVWYRRFTARKAKKRVN